MDDPRLRRIALVTRRYGDLRAGVTRAIWGPCILALGAVEYLDIHRGLWADAFGLLALLFKALPNRPEEAARVDAS
jgi:hypothetical protein